MKKMFVVILLSSVILTCFCVSAGEKPSLIYFDMLPKDVLKNCEFLNGSQPLRREIARANVTIPGLPVQESFLMSYTRYRVVIPNKFRGQAIMWNDLSSFWPLKVHIAVREDVKADTIIHEMYHSAFLRFLASHNFDLEKLMSREKDQLLFSFRSKKWTYDQLDEAIACSSVIFLAKEERSPKLIEDNFRETAKTPSNEYKLARYLLWGTKSNPDLYLKGLEQCVKNFLAVAPKSS
jgi:hypothetical protein